MNLNWVIFLNFEKNKKWKTSYRQRKKRNYRSGKVCWKNLALAGLFFSQWRESSLLHWFFFWGRIFGWLSKIISRNGLTNTTLLFWKIANPKNIFQTLKPRLPSKRKSKPNSILWPCRDLHRERRKTQSTSWSSMELLPILWEIREWWKQNTKPLQTPPKRAKSQILIPRNS